ncbi:hypothetical protein GW17_00023354 [Ensete ventricosum]|nr:hypothetical protein GW17_00023354 [Ensete ventricosum]RZR88716.1 hypothetical protein BHM03_00016345 [Ensete ventricosum]
MQSLGGCNRCQMINLDQQSGQLRRAKEPLATLASYRRVQKGLPRAPHPLKTRSEERDQRRYYRFHCDYDHDIVKCYNLKNQIKDLIRRGHLGHYVRKSCEPLLYPKGLMEKQINVIVGGPTSRGDNFLARKAYARAMVEKRPRHECDPEITFKSGEEEYLDHDDTLVISAQITNARVKRIMVDIGTRGSHLYISPHDEVPDQCRS